MDGYITRDSVYWLYADNFPYTEGMLPGDFQDMLDTLPNEKVVPVDTSTVIDNGGELTCSKCKSKFRISNTLRLNFCPTCGRKFENSGVFEYKFRYGDRVEVKEQGSDKFVSGKFLLENNGIYYVRLDNDNRPCVGVNTIRWKIEHV